MHRKRPVLAHCAAFALAAFALGCNTIDTRTNQGYRGPRTYSGTRVALSLAGSAFMRLNPPEVALWLGDAALSATADTLLLPITIPEQIRLNRETAQRLRTDVEQPGVLRPINDESPLNTAKRLFRECSSHVLNIKPELTDCYSIDAKIELDGEELTGAEYKTRLRAEYLPLRGGSSFVRLRDPDYEVREGSVLITARRLEADTQERTPITWIVGPGPDGVWRILEERSQGLP